MALLVQKLCGGKELSKSVFGYSKTKKKRKEIPTAIKLWGGGKALMARPLREKLFLCGFSKELLLIVNFNYPLLVVLAKFTIFLYKLYIL